MNRARVLALLVAVTSNGCAVSKLYSGLAPGYAPKNYTQRWHPSFLLGTIDGSDAYRLERICPHGWAEIVVEQDPFTLLAGVLTLFVYSPSRVTVVCAAPSNEPPLEGSLRAPASDRPAASRAPR